jgi:glutamine amidotransferase
MIVIVDYKAGNLTSVQLAFAALGVQTRVTSQPQVVDEADKIVFPGVGAAGASMQNLQDMGLLESLRTSIASGKPFLGICVGMQILFEYSEEDGGTDCMGILPGKVQRFRPSDPFCKIPHMGWNTVHIRRSHPLLHGIEDESEFYFVHSYCPCAAADDDVIGLTHYADVTFSSIVGRENLAATQFHTERSGRIGLQLLKNFTQWNGQC